jgi:hypothetical protein
VPPTRHACVEAVAAKNNTATLVRAHMQIDETDNHLVSTVGARANFQRASFLSFTPRRTSNKKLASKLDGSTFDLNRPAERRKVSIFTKFPKCDFLNLEIEHCQVPRALVEETRGFKIWCERKACADQRLGKGSLANAEGHSTLSYLKRVLALEMFDIERTHTASFFWRSRLMCWGCYFRSEK